MTSPAILLKTNGVRPKKMLGQNFLSDSGFSQKLISKALLSENDTILEIGAGLGAITLPAACAVKKVYAVEKDKKIADILKNELASADINNVSVIQKSILKVDLENIFEKTGRKMIVVGNLPYNISSQILIYLIKHRKFIDKAFLMFQKELAERLMSKVNTKQYGRIAVLLQYCAHVESFISLKSSLFYPAPKVDSKVLKIVFNDQYKEITENESHLFKTVKAGFCMRRKTLKNALSGSELCIEKNSVVNSLKAAKIDPERRAETLTVSEFVALSNSILKLQ